MRKLMWISIGFSAACLFCAYCYNSWLLYIAITFALLGGIFLALTKMKRHFRIPCAICLGIAMGLASFHMYNLITLENVRSVNGKTETVTIQVSDFSYQTDHGCAFDGKITIGGRGYKVRVYLASLEHLEPGQYVRGEFYFQMTVQKDEDWLNHAGKGIFLFAYQRNTGIEIAGSQRNWTHYPAIWRQELKNKISKVFPDDVEGFANALLLGDTSGIDYETDTNLKISGIRHVIAVSGLHISAAFGLLYLLAGKKRLLTALIGIPAVTLFAALSGFTPSVTRACIMQILMMAALLLDKEYDPPTALAFAVLVMLIANPMAICSVSFQLSVGCMIGIFLFSQRIYNWLTGSAYFGKGKNRVSVWVCGSIAMTLSTMVTTLPLTAYYFGTISLIGIVTNLICLWAIAVVFYGIILVCLLGFVFAPLAQIIGLMLGWLIRYVIWAAVIMAAVPLAAVYTNSVYIVIWLIFAYLLMGVYMLIRKKPAVLLCTVLICGLCVAVLLSWVEPLLGECRVTMLDVGQGQAILLQSRGKTFLIDCGGDYDKGAADTTAQTLLSQGIRRLDGIIITHYDTDHAGGIPYLLTRVGTNHLFLPYVEDTDSMEQNLRQISNATLHSVEQDVKINYDNVEITIFAPVSYNSGNESSMCVLFQTENCDILIIGDRSEKTEKILLENNNLPELDVLIVGHHGSKTSTSEELLEATKPEYAFISVGKDNSYGHPAQETIERLTQFGCKILRTDQNGTVIFRR